MKRRIVLVVALLVCLPVYGFAGHPVSHSQDASNGIGGTPVDPPAQASPYIQGATHGPDQLAPGEISAVSWPIGSLPYNWVAVCNMPVTVTNISSADIPVGIFGTGPGFVTFAPNNVTCKGAALDGTPNTCAWTVMSEYTSTTPAPTQDQWNGISVQNNSTGATLSNVTIEVDCVAYPATNQFGSAPPWF